MGGGGVLLACQAMLNGAEASPGMTFPLPTATARLWAHVIDRHCETTDRTISRQLVPVKPF